MSVPVDEKASHYAVKTRSYITYDNDTNQAGFGYYRFLDIVNVQTKTQLLWKKKMVKNSLFFMKI